MTFPSMRMAPDQAVADTTQLQPAASADTTQLQPAADTIEEQQPAVMKRPAQARKPRPKKAAITKTSAVDDDALVPNPSAQSMTSACSPDSLAGCQHITPSALMELWAQGPLSPWLLVAACSAITTWAIGELEYAKTHMLQLQQELRWVHLHRNADARDCMCAWDTAMQTASIASRIEVMIEQIPPPPARQERGARDRSPATTATPAHPTWPIQQAASDDSDAINAQIVERIDVDAPVKDDDLMSQETLPMLGKLEPPDTDQLADLPVHQRTIADVVAALSLDFSSDSEEKDTANQI
jgi:hypothetical protein